MDIVTKYFNGKLHFFQDKIFSYYLADTFKIVYISNIIKTLKNIINSKRYTQSKCNKYLIIFIEKKGRYVSYS